MKKVYLFFAAMALGGHMFAKPVDMATAQKAGFNFLTKKINSDALLTPTDLHLVHSGANAYYVFNAGKAGFVMIAADDQVTPVLGYSTEDGFDANNIPPVVKDWLQNYADEIAYVVDNNIPATDLIKEEWYVLKQGRNSGQKTTATEVFPLLTTKWNQTPYYNALCPSDGSGQAVTGCVATSMAQIMKFWNYPAVGTGAHSYYHSTFGQLSADFSTTNYNWTVMPNSVTNNTNQAAKTEVATLMFHCGVAVEMGYGVASSGAYTADVVDALKNYYKYASSANMIYRNNYSSIAQWVNKLKTELDQGRPVLYSGRGSGGGHAWVADGYNANDQLHMNWGWGGSSDGYFTVTSLNPGSQGAGGGTDFNSAQGAIIGITPPVTMTPDSYEPNNQTQTTYKLSLGTPGVSVSVKADASIHIGSDIDYYNIILPTAGTKYKVTARVHDLTNSGNGKSYTVDVRFGHSTDQKIWSAYIDSTMNGPIEIEGGKDLYFRVAPKTLGALGTYFFEATATNVALGIGDAAPAEMIVIYPNPASDVLNISMEGVAISGITLTDMQGRVVRTAAMQSAKAANINVSGLANGMYLLNMQSDNGTITRKISVGK